MRFSARIALALVFGVAAGTAHAFGPHQELDCLGCHDPHYAKAQKLFKVENTQYPNPRTGKPIDGISALCLGCHNLQEYGGAGVRPIYLHMTHPVNVTPNPKIATVPDQLLRDGILQCVSCHDPHPSNPNWRYLRVNTESGSKVGQFCATCHGAKADKKFYGAELAQGNIQLFSSMNESVGAGTYALNDPKLVVSNPTPSYIQPLGKYENSLLPAYMTAIQKPWVFNSAQQDIPADLQKLKEQNAPPKPGKDKRAANDPAAKEKQAQANSALKPAARTASNESRGVLDNL